MDFNTIWTNLRQNETITKNDLIKLVSAYPENITKYISKKTTTQNVEEYMCCRMTGKGKTKNVCTHKSFKEHEKPKFVKIEDVYYPVCQTCFATLSNKYKCKPDYILEGHTDHNDFKSYKDFTEEYVDEVIKMYETKKNEAEAKRAANPKPKKPDITVQDKPVQDKTIVEDDTLDTDQDKPVQDKPVVAGGPFDSFQENLIKKHGQDKPVQDKPVQTRVKRSPISETSVAGPDIPKTKSRDIKTLQQRVS